MRPRPGRDTPGGLLPHRWRVTLAVLVPVSAVGVVGLGLLFAGDRRAGPLDRFLDGHLAVHGGAHEELLWGISALGSPPVLPVGLLLLAAFGARRGWPAVVLALAGPSAAVLLTEFVAKPLVGRTLYGGLALPSGHTTSITAMAWVLVLVFVAGRQVDPGPPGAATVLRPALLSVLAGLAVLGVAGSMVALRRHYATDTAAGVLVGTAVVGALALALDAVARARSGDAPGATRPGP